MQLSLTRKGISNSDNDSDVVRLGGYTDSNGESVMQQLLDSASPQIKSMWQAIEASQDTAFRSGTPKKKRKMENPQRYLATVD